MNFFNLKYLPEGYAVCMDIENLYRLKYRKRTQTINNIELDIGKTYYVYSHFKNIYYEKVLNSFSSIEKLEKYIKLKILYYKP